MTTKINCLADIIAHTPRVRVIKENDELYWKEFDIVYNNYREKHICIKNIRPWYVIYQYSEIQFLTPIQYEWRFIGLGDKVNGEEVFSYCWYDSGWNIRSAKEYNNIHIYDEHEIRSFEPLHQLTPKIELSTEEMIEELRRRGVVTQGDIINK